MFKYVMKFDKRSKSRTNNFCLTKSELKSIKQLFEPYIKVRPYAHAFYKEKTGLFSQNYIPDSIHIAYIDPFFNDWTLAKYIDNKCYYPRLFAGINLPHMIAYRLNNYWYEADGNIISESDVVKSVLENKCKCFIKKATNSYGGKGVFYFDGTTMGGADLMSQIRTISGDLVIQKGITQSKTLSLLHQSSVNTIRHMSFMSRTGEVKVLSSILRMGAGGSKVDNASSGGITTGIEPDGRLKSVAYSAVGVKFNEHPSTHVKFSDIIIPNFDKTIDLVLKSHPKFPHFRLISWDIALGENDEPILIEANLCDGELDFHQLNNGPIFKEYTKEILNEVFGVNFNARK